jgi:hypothetical protein
MVLQIGLLDPIVYFHRWKYSGDGIKIVLKIRFSIIKLKQI